MRRRDEWREIVAEWRGELRAGWHDARRTPAARPWHGGRWGDRFYAVGYALGEVPA